MARIKPTMFVSCNKTSSWNTKGIGSYIVKEGHIGVVLKTDSSASVAVKWLALQPGDLPACIVGHESTGPYECLDLLTPPVNWL